MAAVYKEQLGELIKEKREALGLTQRALADKAHVKESTTVSRWERGEREPTDLEAVAQALGTTASAMLSELSPLHQKDRIRLDPAAPSQLDRIEAMLRVLIQQIPDSKRALERELLLARERDAARGKGTVAAPRTPRRKRKAQ